MSYECFEVTIENQIAHLQLCRPEKRNSMTPTFWRELPQIVNDLDQNAKARVIVISSTGKAFTAGMDLAVFGADPGVSGKSAGDEAAQKTARLQHGARFHDTVAYYQESFSCLENCRIPVLAAIQGACVGGGVDFVTACDMRYATEDAFLSIFEINIGMTADVGTFPRLVKLIPEGVVRELAYTGRRIYAEEARNVGLVNRVFPDQETMLAEVMTIAAEIARKPPMAVYGSKKLINYSRDHSTADTLDYIAAWNAAMLLPSEMREAMTANAEKRSGKFVDLPKKRAR
jgi:enoyl-CoA hydratase